MDLTATWNDIQKQVVELGEPLKRTIVRKEPINQQEAMMLMHWLQSIQAQSRTAITMSKTLTQNYTRQLSAPEQEFIKAELAKAAASEAQKAFQSGASTSDVASQFAVQAPASVAARMHPGQQELLLAGRCATASTAPAPQAVASGAAMAPAMNQMLQMQHMQHMQQFQQMMLQQKAHQLQQQQQHGVAVSSSNPAARPPVHTQPGPRAPQ